MQYKTCEVHGGMYWDGCYQCAKDEADHFKEEMESANRQVDALAEFAKDVLYGRDLSSGGHRATPNGWYKRTDKTWGQVLDEILAGNVPSNERSTCGSASTPWKSSLPCIKDSGHDGDHEDVTGCHWK